MKSSHKPKPTPKPRLDKILQITNEETEIVKYSHPKALKRKPSFRRDILLHTTRTQDLCNWLSSLFCCVTSTNTYQLPTGTLSAKELAKEITKLQKLSIKPILPPNKGPFKKTLVLDVDETLLHSAMKLQSFDFSTQMRKNGKDMSVMTKQRPGLEYFVSEMSKHYEVIVFNSSVESYSEEMVAKIDPKNRIKYHLYREHCITLNNLCIKNLKLLNRDLTQLVLLDNNKSSALMQPDRLLLISSFYNNEKDRQLLKIIPFLKHLSSLEEIPDVAEAKTLFDNQQINISELKQQESFAPCLSSDKMRMILDSECSSCSTSRS